MTTTNIDGDDREPCPCCLGDPDTVCDACDQHACWAGIWMCDESASAGTRQKESK